MSSETANKTVIFTPSNRCLCSTVERDKLQNTINESRNELLFADRVCEIESSFEEIKRQHPLIPFLHLSVNYLFVNWFFDCERK